MGKSTFFNAATLLNVPVASYPFTTINPNFGSAYIRVRCVHEELGVSDNPVNSACVNGTRLIPVRLVDVAGLVPGASSGRGLGNKFLDDLRQADALVYVVDASGATDEEGRQVSPGSHDPRVDIEFVHREFVLWVKSIVEKDWQRISRTSEAGSKGSSGSSGLLTALFDKLSGLSIGGNAVESAIQSAGLKVDKPTTWSPDDLFRFCEALVDRAKPFLVAANKCDQPISHEIIDRLRRDMSDRYLIVPCAAEAELLLRRASERGVIHYVPGDENFSLAAESTLTPQQKRALELVRKQVLEAWNGTGVQKIINAAYLELLKGIVVYPVEDDSKLTDKKGNVLPDARVMHRGDTARDLAYTIHTDLGKGFLYAVDVRTGMRLGADYVLRNNDVMKIVARAR